jgi:hypothetical protein
MKKLTAIAVVATMLAGCATVRQPDLDAWVGMPVEALDTHTFFITLPMSKRTTASGIEVRNYANTATVTDCDETVFATANKGGKSGTAFGSTECTSTKTGCNNIFYIKDSKIIEYAPTGRCMTNDSLRPQKRYLELMKKGG